MQTNLAEAERRIEEARTTGAENLDLGDLALSELPASLGKLPSLRVLHLGRVRLNKAGEPEWDGDRKRPVFTDLAPLAGLQNLRSLDLAECGGVTDLSPLSGLAGLQSLDLLYCRGVTELSPLSGLGGLQRLDLGSTGVTDLSPLSGLGSLQSLDLRSTGVTDLSPLSGLNGLQSLNLLYCQGVTDLSPLSGLAGLHRLDLSYMDVRDLSPLLSLGGLQSLSLSGTGVVDLSPLCGLTGLQSLDLRGCEGVSDLSPLSNLGGLQSLDLGYMGVTDLSPLSGLAELQSLYLYGCPPARLRIVANRPRLSTLFVSEAFDVPPELLSGEEYDNCLPRLRTYFSKLDLGSEVENEMKALEVFISYAWGDETPEGKIRDEAVEHLVSALAQDGFNPVRDQDRIRPGELISAFIRQLTRADHIVAIVSDKYLRSPYCMYEIYRLWQRCQGNADDLADRVVPVVLPEVKIKNVRERLPYLQYWADEAETLEALVRDPKISVSRESWEEVRLVRQFAQHVDEILVFLQDVLMPRNLEAHFDNGFEAVREALRRRVG